MAATMAFKRQEYEDFLNNRLRGDLAKAHALHNTYKVELEEWDELEQRIRKMQKEDCTRLEERVELGQGVFMQAEIPDASHIFVSIGLGFYAEFLWEEALQLAAMKRAALQAKLQEMNAKGELISSHIKLVEEGLEQLQQLSEMGES